MCLSKKNTVRREFFSTIETIEEYTHARSFSSVSLTLHPQVHLDPYLVYQGKTVPVSGDVGALLPAFAVPFGILFQRWSHYALKVAWALASVVWNFFYSFQPGVNYSHYKLLSTVGFCVQP